ncbi:MAG: hypothetical protein JXB88_16305 [Spirochaetales bacterium]|nr:hypothetical protein [Spirochaetales bacterium]
MIIAGIQINSNNRSEENLKKVFYLLEKAMDMEPDIIVLPEYTNYIGPLDKAYSSGLTKTSIWHKQLSGFAKINNVGIIAGLLLKAKDKKVSSSVLYFDKEGTWRDVYQKLHLFDAVLDNKVNVRESEFLSPGPGLEVFTINKIPCGFAVCYDLRFPELFRRFTLQKARIIFVPAAFTHTTGKAHWEILVRARAIENQVFIIAINQVGEHIKGKISYGMSMIVDPWGTILARAPAAGEDGQETIITATLDFPYQDSVRENMPCLSHRREDLFQ